MIDPKLLIVTPCFGKFDYRAILNPLVKKLLKLNAMVLVDPHKLGSKLGRKMIPYEELLNGNYSTSLATDVSPHDIVNIQFTSGSTGLPKAAALSHYNIMNCGQFIALQMGMTAEDQVCLPVPLFHSFGLIIGKFASA